MELVFLGTGAGKPSKERNASAIALNLLQERGSVWLFDCGEATQHQFMYTSLSITKLEKIFITHLHGDHIFGLPGVLTSRSMEMGEIPLTIYGPKGIRTFIDTTLTISSSFLTYPLEIIEIEEGIIFEDDQFKVHVLELDHRIQTFGFRITEKDKPGSLDAGKLVASGVPAGSLFNKLKMEGRLVLDSGKELLLQNYVTSAKPGKVITIFGDTLPTANALILAKDADFIVHEATMEAALIDKAIIRGHSTTVQAATLAKNSGCKRLIITHISQRYFSNHGIQLLNECRDIFPATDMAYDLSVFSL